METPLFYLNGLRNARLTMEKMKNHSEERMIKGKIFADKEALQATYIPEELLHRDEQIKDLADTLSKALNGGVPSNILISGNTGTGKTVTAKYVNNVLEQKIQKKTRKKRSECSIIYVNCELFDTLYRVNVHIANVFKKKYLQYCIF